jgi:hypothetical protein
VISPEGNVTHTRILRGVPLVSEAVVDAVSQWQYAPTMLNGHAVPVAMAVTIAFKLP